MPLGGDSRAYAPHRHYLHRRPATASMRRIPPRSTRRSSPWACRSWASAMAASSWRRPWAASVTAAQDAHRAGIWQDRDLSSTPPASSFHGPAGGEHHLDEPRRLHGQGARRLPLSSPTRDSLPHGGHLPTRAGASTACSSTPRSTTPQHGHRTCSATSSMRSASANGRLDYGSDY